MTDTKPNRVGNQRLDENGVTIVECMQQHPSGRLCRLSFRWDTRHLRTLEFDQAKVAQQRSMDHLMRTPIAEIERAMPWALEPLAPDTSKEPKLDEILGIKPDGTFAAPELPATGVLAEVVKAGA